MSGAGLVRIIKKNIMSKTEKAKWDHFGNMHSMGKSVPQGWFGVRLLDKWIKDGLVRTVRHWEDSVQVAKNGMICEWNAGEIIATEKGLESL
jgi:hypothetical protein